MLKLSQNIEKYCAIYCGLLLLSSVLFFKYSNYKQQMAYNYANIQLLSGEKSSKSISGGSAYLQGMVAYRQQQYSQAVSWFQLASYDNTLRRWYLAQAENRNGSWRVALDILDLAIPEEEKLHFDILFEHFLLLSAEERAEWQQRILYEYPEMIIPYATYLLDNHHYLQAREWAQATADFEYDADAQMVVGWSYFYTENFSEAETAFRTAYQLSPNGVTSFAYGRALMYQNKLSEALPLLEEAVRVESSDGSIAWYLSELGVTYARVGDCPKANSAFERSLSIDSRIENIQRIEKARALISELCN